MRNRPLHPKKHDLPLHFAITNKLKSEARLLIEGGTDVDARDSNKRTALMLCCLENDEFWAAGVTRMLLQAGANAGLKDVNGRNALIFAVIFSRKSIVDILLHAIDYDVNQRDGDGKSALNYALLHGDTSMINTITNACGQQIADHSGLRKPNSKEKLFHGKPEVGRHHFKERPQAACRLIIQNERSSARIHRSNSDMNVHKFRRGTMQDFLLKSGRRRTSTSIGSRSWTSSSHRSVSLHIAGPQSQHVSERWYSDQQRYIRSWISQAEIDNRGDKSWKAYVPGFWHIFTQQCCSSYRPSAVPVSQTLEEALGIPHKEEMTEEEVLTDGEQSGRTVKSQLVTRRSSMPNSPNLISEAPVYRDKGRRRSEASVSISATTLRSLMSGAVARNASDIDSENIKNNSVDINQGSISVSERREFEKNKENISVDVSPPQTPLRTPLRRSDSKNVSNKTLSSARTPIIRNRPGSALRQQPIRRQTSDGLSVSRIDVNRTNAAADMQEILNRPKAEVGQSTLTNVASQNSPTKTQSSVPPAKEGSTDQNRAEQDLPKRSPRRQESILFQNRVLTDIIEENENIADRQNRATLSPTKSKASVIRPTSAYVRGRMANGHL